MEERSVENPHIPTPKIRKQVEEELFNSYIAFNDSDNFHTLLKEELGSADNIDKRINRFKKRKHSFNSSSEKAPKELNSGKEGFDVEFEERGPADIVGHRQKRQKMHLSKSDENIDEEENIPLNENISPTDNFLPRENDLEEEDFDPNARNVKSELSSCDRPASNAAKDIQTVLKRVNMIHLYGIFQKELIDFDILKASSALELRQVLGIPFGLAKQIRMEVDKIEGETAISDYFMTQEQ